MSKKIDYKLFGIGKPIVWLISNFKSILYVSDKKCYKMALSKKTKGGLRGIFPTKDGIQD
jgi:hypothetical protein